MPRICVPGPQTVPVNAMTTRGLIRRPSRVRRRSIRSNSTLGSWADINVGGELCAGWRLPDDFGTSSIRPGGDNAAPRAAAQLERLYHQQSFHLFASFDGRVVANNIFLDGNMFKRSHAVKKTLLVGDIAYGWAYTWPKYPGFPSGKLAYAHYVQSREFEGEARNHGCGSVNVSLEF